MVELGAAIVEASKTVIEATATKEIVASEVVKNEVIKDAVEGMAKEIGTDILKSMPNEIIKNVEKLSKDVLDKTRDVYKNVELFSTYDERIIQTPKNGWMGERGESLYKPDSSEAASALRDYGLEGVEYENGIPDFSKCSEYSVEIDMIDKRESFFDENGNRIAGNYERANSELANVFNSTNKDGKGDWTYNDVEKWRANNKLTIHEDNDMKTCYYVPTEIHKACTHSGGVAECKKKAGIGGGFDA